MCFRNYLPTISTMPQTSTLIIIRLRLCWPSQIIAAKALHSKVVENIIERSAVCVRKLCALTENMFARNQTLRARTKNAKGTCHICRRRCSTPPNEHKWLSQFHSEIVCMVLVYRPRTCMYDANSTETCALLHPSYRYSCTHTHAHTQPDNITQSSGIELLCQRMSFSVSNQ